MSISFYPNAEGTRADILLSGVKVAEVTPNGITGSIPLGQPMWWPMRSSIQAGFIALDGQELPQATYPGLYQMLVDGLLPTVSEATWQSTPTQRGKFVVESSTGMFRMADLNGISVGTLGAVVQRGDGEKSAGEDGVIQLDEIKAHVHGGVAGGGTIDVQNSVSPNRYSFNPGANTTSTGGVENRVLNVTGCWVCKAFGTVINPGSADAAQLASDYANLINSFQALDAQLDFAIVYPNGGTASAPGTVAINTVYSVASPWPTSHVMVCAEVLFGGKWGATGWAYRAGGIGVLASEYDGTITVVTGEVGLLYARTTTGSAHNTPTANYVTPIPCRVKVWKLKGAV